MRVRICIAVNDHEGTAAAHGWEISSVEDPDERWTEMQAARRMLEESDGGEPTRFVWAEAEIPMPGTPAEACVLEIHRARQKRDES